MRKLKLPLLILLILLASLIVVGALLPRRSFPQTSGEIRLPGLDGPVDIYRDSYGIPQIYATTSHDLFMAQGYTHAQDRFWQMDVWRHTGSGTLSEMFGESQVETDAFLRTVGWARVAQKELASLDADSLALLQAYADGVDAYLAAHKGSQISLEYAILGLLTPSYKPGPWEPLHTITWGKAMAWDLRGNMDEEIQRAILLETLTPEQVDELFPLYPDDHAIIVQHPHLSATPRVPGGGYRTLVQAASPALEAVADRFALLDSLRGAPGAGIGSNSWVIAGDHTATGKPLLANDPHLSAQLPSIWYEIGLHCVPKSAACPYEVTGFSFAGAPGVVIGHNDRIAWGFTNLGPDVMDLYIEKINPANPNQYEVNGEWVDMDILTENISVGGSDPMPLTIRYTRHGPLITDVYGKLEDFTTENGLPNLPESYAIALRWTALDPGFTFRAIWGFNRAQNWAEFRAATRDFAVPSQNLVYADIEGNIGYQGPGMIPIRASGDGYYPVPGWTDEYEWTGFIPFEDLPYAFNPPEGYLVTANNAVIPADYPYFISREWDYGYRATRIVELVEQAPRPITAETLQTIQGDDKNLNAVTLVPIVMQLPLPDARLQNARALFEGWDYQQHMDSAAGALFETFWKNLLTAAFADDLPEKYWPGGSSQWFEVVRRLSADPASPWWDDQTTPALESRDDIFLRAFTAAVDELEAAHGKDPAKWAWGDLHTLTLTHQTLGKSGVGPIEALFNRGPFRTSGGSSIVNATGWNAQKTYEVVSVPSMRMIVDLSNLQNSLTIHTTGQSGHAYNPHYTDMTDLWRLIQYHPMLWERAAVEAAATDHLRLVP